MKVASLQELHNYAIDFATKLHPDDYELTFLSGSLIRGGFGNLSDIDYTCIVREKLNHPKFKFQVVEYAGILRPVSIFFFRTDELDKSVDQIDEEYYLWMKGMMEHAEFIHGNKGLYDKILAQNTSLEFAREANHKTLHKSLGKLLELIQKVKKYEHKQNQNLITYYGLKLAEHTRRLVQELNPPLALKSESQFYDAYLDLDNTPENFRELYTKVARYNLEAQTPQDYFKSALELVNMTIAWIKRDVNYQRLDQFSQELLEDPDTETFLQTLDSYAP